MSTITVTTVRPDTATVATIRETVVSTVHSPIVVSTGLATGPAGARGGSYTAIAAHTVSGHRIVTDVGDGTIQYADNLTPAHAWAPLGMTTGAAIAGDPVTFLRAGTITEPSWTLTPLNPVFLGANGTFTQTPPVAPAFSRVLGTATTSTSIWIHPSSPLQLT